MRTSLLTACICGLLLALTACGGSSQEPQKAPAATAPEKVEKKAILSDETIKYAPQGAQFDIDADGRKEFGDDAAKNQEPEDNDAPPAVRPSKFREKSSSDHLLPPSKEQPVPKP